MNKYIYINIFVGKERLKDNKWKKTRVIYEARKIRDTIAFDSYCQSVNVLLRALTSVQGVVKEGKVS